MEARSDAKKKKALIRTAIFGAVSAVLYAAVFTHANFIVHFFAKGGVYAALPVATVFVFSFAHGSFASNLWSALGIEAITKQPAKRPTVTAPRPAQRPRPRVRMSV